jgi:subtilisin family serine protease
MLFHKPHSARRLRAHWQKFKHASDSRRLHMEHLEARYVLSASAAASYFQVSSDWFSEIAGSTANGSASVTTPSLAPSSVDADDRWIVRLTPEALTSASTVATAAELLAQNGLPVSVLRGLGLPGQLLVSSALESDAVSSALANSPLVSYFQRSHRITGAATPNDAIYAFQAGLNNVGQLGGTIDADIDAPDAWNVSTGTRDVVVAVIDSGIERSHPDLAANVWTNSAETPGDNIDNDNNGFIDDVNGWDFLNADNAPVDDHGHGTHVAGIIGAAGNNSQGIAGVNWQVSLMPLKFLDHTNTGETADAVAAINYVTMLRTRASDPVNVRVINASWISGSIDEPALRNAIAAAGLADILFVAAAGNGDALGRGLDIDQFPAYPASYGLDNVITVAATDQSDALARFSNFGATNVDIAAPGVGIWSTDLGASYQSRNGTSMAAPHVAGVAALVIATAPTALATEVKAAILAGGDAKTALQGVIASGKRLNANGALLVDTVAPHVASHVADDILVTGASFLPISIEYRDNKLLNIASFDNNDLVIRKLTGAGGTFSAQFQSVNINSNGAQRTALYHLAAPGGVWDTFDNGTYQIELAAAAVADVTGNLSRSRVLGTFVVDITADGIFEVDTEADAVDANVGDNEAADAQGRVTLRAALQEANLVAGISSIILPAGTYMLSVGAPGEDAAAAGDLDVIGDVTILSDGSGDVVIDASDLDRVFDVHANGSLTLEGVTIRGGSLAGADGAGVRNAGTLFVRESTVRNNTTDHDGGGVANFGTLIVEASTFTLNSAARGGAVWNGGDTTATNTTFSGNLASTSGGGLFNAAGGDATLINTTITLNSTAGSGSPADDAGGITAESGGAVELHNTLVAGNTSVDTSPDVTGTYTSLGGNLVGDATTAAGIVHGLNNDQAGSGASPILPLLGPLADNTGPTMTHELLPGSPAIDRGINTGAPSEDQRGLPRPQDADGNDTATVDVGATERYYVEIAGVWYFDVSGNSTRDAGEAGVVGETVFLDANKNGELDPEETSTLTLADDPGTIDVDEAGSYRFLRLVPEEYVVAAVGRGGWKQTAPIGFTEFRKWKTPIGSEVGEVHSADLNGDTLPDVVVADLASDRFQIYINLGEGTFAAPYAVNPGIPFSEYDFLISDVDNDGKKDLVSWVTDYNHAQAGRISVLWGNGNGTFAAPLFIPQVAPNDIVPYFLNALDLDGDNDLDLFFSGNSHSGGRGYRIALNNGNRTFNLRPTQITPGNGTGPIQVADLNGDGRQDIVTTPKIEPYDGVDVHINLGNGSVSTPTRYGSGFASGGSDWPITLADFNGDGAIDIAYPAFRTAQLHILENNGSGAFNSEYIVPIANTRYHDMVAADFDDDGSVDLAIFMPGLSQITFYFNDGFGQFSRIASEDAFGAHPDRGEPLDSDGDGDTDLVVLDYWVTSELLVHTNTGPTFEISPHAGAVIATADFGETPLRGEIRGTLFNDVDDDGVRELSETFLAGWTVYIDADGSNTLTAGDPTAVSGASGEYVFANLAPFASYTLRVVLQQGWHVTFPSIGDDREWTVAIDPGESFTGSDFGLFDDDAQGGGSASIAGRVFDDLDGNGQMDDGERGLGGRTVYLDLNDNGIYEPAIDVGTETTIHPQGFPGDVGGFYSFDGLGARNFVVRLDVADGELTANPAGNAYAIDEYTVGANPVEVLSADFNQDGLPDLATADGSSNQVSVRLQDAAGNFGPSAGYSVGVDPTGIAIGNFNNDAFPDIAVVHFSLSRVVLLLNDGDGTFTRSPNEFTVPSGYTRIASADFNGDSRSDLAVAVDGASDLVRILINNGTGGFTALPNIAIGTGGPVAITAGLLNADTFPDLVVANFGSDTVQIIRNNGGTSFTALSPVGVGDAPSSVTLADMNGDEKLDVVVANFGTDNVAVLLGDGLGGLGVPSYVAAGQGPRAVVSADIDDDADTDLIVANITVDDVVVLRNQGGSFGFAESAGAASFAGLVQQGVKSLLAADLDGDGLVDAAAVNGDFFNGSILVLNNFKAAGSHRLTLDGSTSVMSQDFAVTQNSSGMTGDYDGDNTVNSADHTFWRSSFGATGGDALAADGNTNGVVDAADYVIWRKNVGSSSSTGGGANVQSESKAAVEAAAPADQPKFTASVAKDEALTLIAWDWPRRNDSVQTRRTLRVHNLQSPVQHWADVELINAILQARKLASEEMTVAAREFGEKSHPQFFASESDAPSWQIAQIGSTCRWQAGLSKAK